MRRSLLPRGARIALACLTMLAAARPAAAQITPGSTLTFTGTADATDIGLGGVALDFAQRVTAGTRNTGTFARLNTRGGSGARGKIADFRVGNGPQLVANFLQFGGYKFTLLGLPEGKYGQDVCYTEDAAVGQTCTPYQSVQGHPEINAGLSPFYVANVAAPDGSFYSTAAFDLFGTVTAPGGATSSFVGTIAATFTGLPYQYVLYTLEQQGLQGLTFTGTFTAGKALTGGDVGPAETVTPEPSLIGLVAAGLLGTALVARRRRVALPRV